MIDVEIIAADPGRQKVLDLPVGILSPGGDPRISNELAHNHAECLATDVDYTILATRFRYIVARIAEGQ